MSSQSTKNPSVLPSPSAHSKSAHISFASYQPPQPGDFLKLTIPVAVGILSLATPTEATSAEQMRSAYTKTQPGLRWVIIEKPSPVFRDDGTIEAYKLTVYPVLSFGGLSGYDHVPLIEQVKCIPIPPVDPRRSNPLAKFVPRLYMSGFVDTRQSWLHVESRTFIFSINDKMCPHNSSVVVLALICVQIRHYTPHIRLSHVELANIATFAHKFRPMFEDRNEAPLNCSNSRLKGSDEAAGGNASLNYPRSALDPPFTIQAWGGNSEWAGNTTPPPPFDCLDDSFSFLPSQSNSGTSGAVTDSSSGYDDPNSEEFMQLVAPERYRKLLEQREAQQGMLVRIRLDSILRWRMGLQGGDTSDGAQCHE